MTSNMFRKGLILPFLHVKGPSLEMEADWREDSQQGAGVCVGRSIRKGGEMRGEKRGECVKKLSAEIDFPTFEIHLSKQHLSKTIVICNELNLCQMYVVALRYKFK